MHSTSQVFVTLSPDLLRHLCELARTQDIPIKRTADAAFSIVLTST